VPTGHDGVVPVAPPGRHSVRTHSLLILGQNGGGTQPQGGLVVVGETVVVVVDVVVDPGGNVVVVVPKSRSSVTGEYSQ
jgi:hypothetical protein